MSYFSQVQSIGVPHYNTLTHKGGREKQREKEILLFQRTIENEEIWILF